MDFNRSLSIKDGNDENMLALANILERGGTEDWQTLYAQAKTSPAIRKKIVAAMELLDAEVRGGRSRSGKVSSRNWAKKTGNRTERYYPKSQNRPRSESEKLKG